MNLQKLSRLDLNLLVSLQALLEEKSVTQGRGAIIYYSASYESSVTTAETSIG